MTLKPKKKDLAAEWREARLLHPLYSALGREFVIELPPCPDLESGVDRSAAGVGRASPRSGFSKWTRRSRSINCANSFRPQV